MLFYVAVPTAWEITHNTTDDERVFLDLSGSPDDIDDSFFIISMNKTREDEDDEHHHDDDDDSDKGRYLFAVNSSRTGFEILSAPAFRNFTGIVYIVNKANDIFKSQEFLVQTGEGGRWYFLWKSVHCVTMRIAATPPVLVATYGVCNSFFRQHSTFTQLSPLYP